MIGNLKMSIIVPVYNGERYIRECLDSLLGQTYKNLEIIVINDGSTDMTRDILLEYEKKDVRVVVLNQENRGTGMARNMGIDSATGDFVTFVDSDDYLLEQCLEKVMQVIGNRDEISLVNWKNQTFRGNDRRVRNSNVEEKAYVSKVFETGKAYLEYLLENGGGTGGVCCKAYRTLLLKNNDLKFGTYKTAEDGHFNTVCLRYLSKVVNLDYIGYMYRKEDYTTHSINNYFNRPFFFISSVESASDRLLEFRETMQLLGETDEYYWRRYYESEFYTFRVVNDENAIYNPSIRNKVKCNKKILKNILSEESLKLQKQSWHMKWLYKIYQKESGIGLYFWNYLKRGFLKSVIIYHVMGKMLPKDSKRGTVFRKMIGR